MASFLYRIYLKKCQCTSLQLGLSVLLCSFFPDLFQKLFRQDLLVASLFRNFLLAERIMRSYNCTPVSSPPLPPTCIFSLHLVLLLYLYIILTSPDMHPMW